MNIRCQRLSRRTVLKAAGVSIGLPLFEAMLPRRTLGAEPPPKRAAFIYIPNGVIAEKWTPTETGQNWQLPPSLEPLHPVRGHVNVISGLDRTYAPGTQVHGQGAACWLTSSPPNDARDGGFPTNVSLDQIIAREIGRDTALPSLELSCNDFTDNHESRYFESISWYAPGYAANTEKQPRAVFDRLFGKPQGGAVNRGVLDVVLQDAGALRRRLGAQDKQKLEEYLESVRATEIRVKRSDRATRSGTKPPIDAPHGIPERRDDYIRLMGELMILAFQQDLTRVATLVIDPERWSSPRMFHGVFDSPQNHHMLTHDSSTEAREKVAKIDRFHVGLFAEIVQRLAVTAEAGGTLLDNCLFVMGSGLGNGYTHSYKDLPILMAGNAGGAISAGRHLNYEGEHPLADLWLSVLHAFGVDRTSFADSVGDLPDLINA